jgi:hypothetical protein
MEASPKPIRATDEQKDAAIKAFQALWVAGTMGALFTALARTLPSHLKHLIFGPADLPYTLDTFLRYGYLLWLLSYFVISNLRIQTDSEREKLDVLYDMLQSVFALSAAYFLDFLATSEHRGPIVFAWPTGAIFLICLLALFLFYERQWSEKKILRTVGSILSGVSLAVVLLCHDGTHPITVIVVLMSLLTLLFLVLWRFAIVRIRSLNVP